MEKCFQCDKNIEQKNGEKYFLINKVDLQTEKEHSVYACETCGEKNRQEVNKKIKNKERNDIIGIVYFEHPGHKRVYTQPTCQKCKKYQKSLCKCPENSLNKKGNSKIKEGQQKCLKCGVIAPVSEDSFCNSCGSKNIEAKYNGIHFTIEECGSCRGVADIRYHNLSPEAAEKQRKLAKQN